jgi:addiction module HigA family antidote
LKEAAKTQSPGEHLRAELKRLGLDQVKASVALGLSRQSINNVINGRQPVSRKMAKKLGALTGRADDYWLRGSFKARKEVAQPVQRKEFSRKRKPKRPVSFHSYVLGLSVTVTPKGDLVGEIKKDEAFAAVATWAKFRFYIMRRGANDERLVIARALWKEYVDRGA